MSYQSPIIKLVSGVDNIAFISIAIILLIIIISYLIGVAGVIQCKSNGYLQLIVNEADTEFEEGKNYGCI